MARRFRCSCDACSEMLAAHDAVTPEGYCGFCARHCFPPAEHDASQRMQLAPAARAELHETFARYGTVVPEDVRHRAAVQSAIAFGKAAVPYVAPHVPKGARSFLAVLAKRLGK